MWLRCLSLGLENRGKRGFSNVPRPLCRRMHSAGRGGDASQANGRAGRRLYGNNGPAPPQRRTCHFDKGTDLPGWRALS